MEVVMNLGSMKFKLLVFVIVAVFMTSAAYAGLIEQNNETDWLYFSDSPIGQTFTAIDNSTLDTMSFVFWDMSPTSGTDSLNIEIYDGIGFVPGNSLGSEDFSLTLGTGLKTFNFTTTFEFIQGNTYSLQLTTTDSRWRVRNNQWRDSGGNDTGTNYDGGDLIMIGSVRDTDDLQFQVSSTPIVPEPIRTLMTSNFRYHQPPLSPNR
jgi:hypothetical protein